MRKFYKLLLAVSIMFTAFSANKLTAQSTLAPGDILFSSYTGVPAAGLAPDTFSFVALVPISTGTIIYFTERGYQGGSSWQGTGSTEGTIKLETSSVFAVGDEIQIAGLGASAATRNGVPIGTVSQISGGNSTTGLSLSNAGDQIIAFQGGGGDPTGASGTPTFIAGINWHLNCGTTTDAGWNGAGCTYGPQSSAMPFGLVGGTSAFLAGTAGSAPNNDQAKFNCGGTPYSTVSALRAAIMNKSNWVFGGATNTTQMNIPPGCLYYSTCSAPTVTAHPPNRTICVNGNTTFSTTATGTALTYQWYVNQGSGPMLVTNTPGLYSGATTSTLTITNAQSAMNGYTYRCVVTGACGSATSNYGTLTVDIVSGFTSVTPVSCNGGSNGTATVTVTSGILPIAAYAWSPTGGTYPSATGLTANTYTVTITDNIGCTGTAQAVITEPAQPVSANVTTVNNVSCPGGTNGNMTVTPSGGTPGYTYLWNTGATTASIFGLTAGTYTCTVRDSKNCPTTASATVTAPPAFVTSSSTTPVSCNGGGNGTATVTVSSGGQAPYTYQWSPSAGSQTTATATGLTAGTYSVTVRDNNLCPTVVSGVTVAQPTNFTIGTSHTNVSCNGGNNGTATVSVSGATAPYSYSWSPSGGTNATATGLAANTYTVTITDNNTCQTTRSFNITQPASSLGGTISKTDVSCNGGSNGTATVVATGGTTPYTYSWSPSGGTNATTTGRASGTYTVTVTDFNGCQITRTITINQPASSLGGTISKTDVSCNGGNNGTATVNVTGGTTPYSYSWSPSGGTNATATGLGTNTYTVTVTDFNGCQITRTTTVNQPAAALSGTISKTDVSCNGGNNGTATVNVTGGTTPYSYSWAPSGGTAATATGLAANTYTVTVTDFNGCQITRNITVNQPSAIDFYISSYTNIACNGGNTGSAEASVPTGGTGAITYEWRKQGSPTVLSTNRIINGLTAGTYICRATDANACYKDVTVTITEPPVLVFTTNSSSSITCNGGSNGTASVNAATGGAGGYVYAWRKQGSPTVISTLQNVSGLTAGTYTCTATDANACSKSVSFTITQPTAVIATASLVQNTTCATPTGRVSVSASGGFAPYTYSWSPNGGTSSMAIGRAEGSYSVVVTDNNSCNATSNSVYVGRDINSFDITDNTINVTAAQSPANTTVYATDCDNMIAAVQGSGANPISGTTLVKVWVETTPPATWVQRHYEITPNTNAATATGTITLFFDQADFDAFNNNNAVKLPANPTDAAGIANLKLEKRSGTSGDLSGLPGSYSGGIETIDPVDNKVVWNAALSRWEVTFDVAGFSGFFVKTENSVLPLKLLSFEGKRSNGINNLVWKTAQESNLTDYEIQRSTNAQEFATIATVKANNGLAHTYTYDDKIEFTGKLYYRIKINENDGKVSYSKIVTLTDNNQSSIINVYPNPARNIITIKMTDDSLQNTEIVVLNAQQRVVLKQKIQSTNQSINVSHLPQGLYFVKFANGEVQKIIKE